MPSVMNSNAWNKNIWARDPSLSLAIPVALLVVALCLATLVPQPASLTSFFLIRQDLPLLGVGVVIAVLARRFPAPTGAPGTLTGIQLAGLALILVLVGWGGHHFLLLAHDMSRDEQMASFDALVYASGRLAEPLPPLWHEHAAALNTTFMYPARPRVAWISNYLPMNSAIRALFSNFFSPALVNPVLAAFGLLALWRCVQRIWPGDREALALAATLYLASGQILITSMTSYAMTGHLALNLIWLSLVLRNDRRGDVAALLVAFVATGLHQPLPHPLFALPLLIWMCRERWRRGAFFLAGYVLIGVFWMYWPNHVWALVQAAGSSARPEGVDFLSRLMQVLTRGDAWWPYEMVANLLRFFAWQHVILLPLVILAWPAVRQQGLPGALFFGVVLTVVTMALILPYQGHGFGYRYLHGLIGSLILVAVYGWKQVDVSAGAWRSVMRNSTLGTVLLLLPLQAWLAHSFYAPFAETRSRLLAEKAEYIVVGARDAPIAQDLVNNRPKLDEHPIFLIREWIVADFIPQLCATSPTVAVVGIDTLRSIAQHFGTEPNPDTRAKNIEFSRQITGAGCRVVGG